MGILSAPDGMASWDAPPQAGRSERPQRSFPPPLERASRFDVPGGDLLVTCAGARSAAQSRPWPSAPHGYLAYRKVYRFRPGPRLATCTCELRASKPTAQRSDRRPGDGITGSQLTPAPAPFRRCPSLPAPDEQRRIVDLLEDHLSRLDAADAYLDAAGAGLA